MQAPPLQLRRYRTSTSIHTTLCMKCQYHCAKKTQWYRARWPVAAEPLVNTNPKGIRPYPVPGAPAASHRPIRCAAGAWARDVPQLWSGRVSYNPPFHHPCNLSREIEMSTAKEGRPILVRPHISRKGRPGIAETGKARGVGYVSASPCWAAAAIINTREFPLLESTGSCEYSTSKAALWDTAHFLWR